MVRPPAKMNHAEEDLPLVVASADIVLRRGEDQHQAIRVPSTWSYCLENKQTVTIVELTRAHVCLLPIPQGKTMITET